jgi:hypothetical protein
MNIDSMFETEQEALDWAHHGFPSRRMAERDGASEPKVMRSNAGFYIGRSKLIDGIEHPYCRLSVYYPTSFQAKRWLDWY